MSRIGNAPITIPEGTDISIKYDVVEVKGPKGTLKSNFHRLVKISKEDDQVIVKRRNETNKARSLHGLTRALIANMVEGVNQGYKKTLELVGTGYRVKKQLKELTFSLGFSHDIKYSAPEGVDLEIEGRDIVHITGIDKQKVGQVAAEIRSLRPPEPYKGKGIRYRGEQVRRKPGKQAKVGEDGGAGDEA